MSQRMPLRPCGTGTCQCGGAERSHVQVDPDGDSVAVWVGCDSCGWSQGSAYGERFFRKNRGEPTMWESVWRSFQKG